MTRCGTLLVVLGGLVAALVAGPLFAGPAAAQSFSIDLAGDASLTTRIVQLFLLITVISLAPAIAMMVTCFPFMVTVLSILRTGIGLQQAPPNMLIISLALFLTYFVMEPVFSDAWRSGVSPLINGDVTEEQGIARTIAPFRAFMENRVSPSTLERMLAVAPKPPAAGEPVPLSVLIASFLLSELQRAFEIGFVIFLPFLIIDLVVAAVLMSMGMMMVPPVVVSLPCKIAFFVVVDGWSLIGGALVEGYRV